MNLAATAMAVMKNLINYMLLMNVLSIEKSRLSLSMVVVDINQCQHVCFSTAAAVFDDTSDVVLESDR